MGISIRWFSRMAVPLFMIVSAFLLAPMKERAVYGQHSIASAVFASFHRFHIHATVQHSTYVVGTDRRRNIYEGLVADIPEFPDASRTLVVYVSSDKPLLFIPIISPWLKKPRLKKAFLYGAVRFVNLYALSQSLVRWKVWGQCF